MKSATHNAAVLLALLIAPAGCIVATEGDDDADAATETAQSAGGSGGMEESSSGGTGDEGGADDSASADESGGDSTGDGDSSGGAVDPPQTDPFAHVGPAEDPAPQLTESGSYECDDCPVTMTDTDDATADAPSTTVTGTTVGHDGPGRFYVEGPSGHISGGMLVPAESNGEFEQTVPLFCGSNTVKLLFRNDAGTSVHVKHIERSGCSSEALRATLAWEDTSQEWMLHLVRFGGTLQDDETDCYDSFYCDGTSFDWGTPKIEADNPNADVDPYLQYAGVASVVIPSDAEDGLTLAVDNVDTMNGGTPRGIVYVSLDGQETQVIPIDGLPNYEVFIAATIDGSDGESTVVAEHHECSETWFDGCRGPLP